MMLSSPESCLCANLSGPYTPRALSDRPPYMPTAKAAAVPLLSRSPRVSAVLAPATSSAASATCTSFRALDSLAERAPCKPLDEPIEKRVVEQRERDRGDQRRGHQRLPEEDVAADQVVRHACGDGALLGARDEGERVDELVHAE